MEWENWESTIEPLTAIAAEELVICAIYAQQHNLLEEEGWRQFNKIAKCEKTLLRQDNQAKLRSSRTAPKYMKRPFLMLRR